MISSMKKLAVLASLFLAVPATYACPGMHHDDSAQTPKTAEAPKKDAPKADADKAKDAPKADAPKPDTAKAKEQPKKPGDKVSIK